MQELNESLKKRLIQNIGFEKKNSNFNFLN